MQWKKPQLIKCNYDDLTKMIVAKANSWVPCNGGASCGSTNCQTFNMAFGCSVLLVVG